MAFAQLGPELTNEAEQHLEKESDKEINKLKYFLEEKDELTRIGDYIEMEIADKRAEKIIAKLLDLVSHRRNSASGRRREKPRRVEKRHIRGKDGFVQGVSLLHKAHHIDRPLNLVCPLEIKGMVASVREVPKAPNQPAEWTRVRRQAAETAREKICRVVADEDDY